MTSIDRVILFLRASEKLYRSCAHPDYDLHLDCVADSFRDWADAVEEQRDQLATALEELDQ